VLYLLSLPIGWKHYRDQKRAYEAANAPAPAAAPAQPAPGFLPDVTDASRTDHPVRQPSFFRKKCLSPRVLLPRRGLRTESSQWP